MEPRTSDDVRLMSIKKKLYEPRNDSGDQQNFSLLNQPNQHEAWMKKANNNRCRLLQHF